MTRSKKLRKIGRTTLLIAAAAAVLATIWRFRFLRGEVVWLSYEYRDAIALDERVPSFGARSAELAGELFVDYWVDAPLMLQGLAWPSDEGLQPVLEDFEFMFPALDFFSWIENVRTVGVVSRDSGECEVCLVTVEAQTGDGKSFIVKVPVGRSSSGRWYALVPDLRRRAKALEDDDA